MSYITFCCLIGEENPTPGEELARICITMFQLVREFFEVFKEGSNPRNAVLTKHHLLAYEPSRSEVVSHSVLPRPSAFAVTAVEPHDSVVPSLEGTVYCQSQQSGDMSCSRSGRIVHYSAFLP